LVRAAFYLLIQKKLYLAAILFVISLYVKASLLIFVPIFLIIALRQKYLIKQYVFSIILSLVVVVLLTLPFSHGNPFVWLYYLYKDKVFFDQLHVVTANAFDFWGIIFGVKDSAVEISDSVSFLGFAYKYWSYILYAIFYIPTLWLVYKKQNIKSIIWSLAIAAFSSFMFLTNMHERYLYPLFPYLTILLVTQSKLIWNYIIVSIINLLNLYNLWWIPVIPGLMKLMAVNNQIVPRILASLNFVLFLFIYFRFWERLKESNVIPKDLQKA
jgi:Gpi18-like mannosyltransferase